MSNRRSALLIRPSNDRSGSNADQLLVRPPGPRGHDFVSRQRFLPWRLCARNLLGPNPRRAPGALTTCARQRQNRISCGSIYLFAPHLPNPSPAPPPLRRHPLSMSSPSLPGSVLPLRPQPYPAAPAPHFFPYPAVLLSAGEASFAATVVPNLVRRIDLQRDTAASASPVSNRLRDIVDLKHMYSISGISLTKVSAPICSSTSTFFFS
jgi:hypothetical protein